MSFQWHKGLFYARFVSVIEAEKRRFLVVSHLVLSALPSTRKKTFLSVEGRGERPLGLWIGRGCLH